MSQSIGDSFRRDITVSQSIHSGPGAGSRFKILLPLVMLKASIIYLHCLRHRLLNFGEKICSSYANTLFNRGNAYKRKQKKFFCGFGSQIQNILCATYNCLITLELN